MVKAGEIISKEKAELIAKSAVESVKIKSRLLVRVCMVFALNVTDMIWVIIERLTGWLLVLLLNQSASQEPS